MALFYTLGLLTLFGRLEDSLLVDCVYFFRRRPWGRSRSFRDWCDSRSKSGGSRSSWCRFDSRVQHTVNRSQESSKPFKMCHVLPRVKTKLPVFVKFWYVAMIQSAFSAKLLDQ